MIRRAVVLGWLMIRINYLDPLVNYLKASPILNNHGIPGVPDIKGKNIWVFSDWSIFKNAKSWTYGVIIKPMESRPNADNLQPNCRTPMEHRVMIGVQVKNARNTQNHFQEDVQAGITSYTGAYPQAAQFEELVRNTVLAYNDSIRLDEVLKPLMLVELPEPEESDGYLMMPSIYQTTYVF